MKDLQILSEKLRLIAADGHTDSAFETAIREVALFYKQNLDLDDDEVAILLTDKDHMVLSFAYPPHLVNSGMIPVSSPDAFASYVFKLNKGVIENSFNQQKHLHLFEYIRAPEQRIRPIWKMMSTVLAVKDLRFGIIEVSRKGVSLGDAGDDFNSENLEFLEKTIAQLAPLIHKILPTDFRGKLR